MLRCALTISRNITLPSPLFASGNRISGGIGADGASEQLTGGGLAGGNLKEKQENVRNRCSSEYTVIKLRVEEPTDWDSIPVNVEKYVSA